MLHACLDRGLKQRVRLEGIALIISERIAHQFWNQDFRGEVQNGVDTIRPHEASVNSMSPTSPT